VDSFEDLIGTPFEFGARPGESEKLDCYGLVVECQRRMGIELPVRQFAESHFVISALMSGQMNEWERTESVRGAVVLFKIRKRACHVGMMIDNFRFIHTWEESGGVCVERIEDWESKVEGYYKYIG
jgi:cell wall-associated NlpC family hydrolase